MTSLIFVSDNSIYTLFSPLQIVKNGLENLYGCWYSANIVFDYCSNPKICKN